MIKKIIKTTFFIFNFAFLISCAYAGSFITVLSLDRSTVLQAQQLLEGKVEESMVKSLVLTIEPFIIKEDISKGYTKQIMVKNGYFSEKITLTPGLNLIKISTLNGREYTVKPVFLLSKEKKLLGDTREWGKNSKIFFVSPQETKVTAGKAALKGMVTDPAIKALDIVVIDTLDLVSETGAEGEKTNIEYKRITVNNQQFSFNAALKEGLNIVLAKEYGKPTATDSLQVKSIIYEKISTGLALDEPELKNNRLTISGKVRNKVRDKVRITISALVEEFDKPNEAVQENILDRTASVRADGTFSLTVPWEVEKAKYTIKSLPTIYVYSGKEVSTRTLVKWW